MTLSHWPNERVMVTYPYVWLDGVFSDEELSAITDLCDKHQSKVATTLGGDSDKRRSHVQFHSFSEDASWIFRKLNTAIEDVNARWYGFELTGYESFQYTEYRGEEEGRYGWHMDTCLGNDRLPSDMLQPRKLSLTILLNDPLADFEGGSLQFNLGDQRRPDTAPSKKGRVVAFPSWIIHRVTPVTKGVRKSMVVWVVGPKFK